MAVNERHGSFQVDVKLSGKRWRPTFKTRAEAEAWELEARAADKLGKPIPPPGGGQVKNAKVSTIMELVEFEDKKRWSGNPKCKSGRKGMADNAYRFALWVGPKLSVAEALTEEKVEAFVEHREDEHNNSGSTINRYIAAIRPLVTRAVKLGLIPEKIELPRRPEGQCRIRFFTEEEEEQILTTLSVWGYDDVRDYFTFLVDTGVRPGEAKKLEWIDFQGRTVVLERDITKNSTQRVITLTPRAQEAVDRMKDRYHNQHPGPFAWATAKQQGIRSLWNRLRGHFDWMG
jgi:integrase